MSYEHLADQAAAAHALAELARKHIEEAKQAAEAAAEAARRAAEAAALKAGGQQ